MQSRTRSSGKPNSVTTLHFPQIDTFCITLTTLLTLLSLFCSFIKSSQLTSLFTLLHGFLLTVLLLLCDLLFIKNLPNAVGVQLRKKKEWKRYNKWTFYCINCHQLCIKFVVLISIRKLILMNDDNVRYDFFFLQSPLPQPPLLVSFIIINISLCNTLWSIIIVALQSVTHI